MPDYSICIVDGKDSLLEDILGLRAEVFIREQGISLTDEIDNLDGEAMHLVAKLDGRVIGTLRMLHENDKLHVGRVAVRKNQRRRGIGSLLLQTAERYAYEKGFTEIILASQISVVPFYERLCFAKYGEVFLDAGIPHVWMMKKIYNQCIA